MNGSLPDGNITAPQPEKKPFYKNRLLIILAVIFLQVIYTFILLNISKINSKSQDTEQTVSAPSEKMISGDELPIGLPLLKNPIISQWWGSAEGVLIAKDEQSITLSNVVKKAQIKIPLNAPQSLNEKDNREPMTIFYNLKLAESGKDTRVQLKDIPVGTYLRGSFAVITWPDDKNKIVGSSFTIVEE